MTSGPKYIAERSVWWEEAMKAVIRRPHLSKQLVLKILPKPMLVILM